MTELLIGCGKARDKRMSTTKTLAWSHLVTLDQFAEHEPDVVHDLECLPYPFEDEQFDEIHAYDVLEHVGRQGDWRFFFSQWSEFHRILKPDGLFFAIVPHKDSPWAWGDPSHTRIITEDQLSFLSQRFYEQVGVTAASDFRPWWKGNLEPVYCQTTEDKRLMFILKKVVQ